MKPDNRVDNPLEVAFHEFIRALQKVLFIQLLLVLFICLSILITVGSIGCSLEYVASLGIALCIISILSLLLSSAYFHDSMKRKALSICHEIVQRLIAAQFQSKEAIAKSIATYAQRVDYTEFDLIAIPYLPQFLSSILNRFARYFAWRYIHEYAEMLFLTSLDQSIACIKNSPLSMQPHASLANCYVMLAQHYAESVSFSVQVLWPRMWIGAGQKLILEAKRRGATKAAIEELSILKTFAPDELWVHDQLAISYKELNMPEAEIQECEEMLRLNPNDQGTQLRLGTLYFQLGLNAKGLIMYDQLKIAYPLLAHELMAHYGSYQPFLYTTEESL